MLPAKGESLLHLRSLSLSLSLSLEAKISYGSGIPDHQFEALRIETMRTDREDLDPRGHESVSPETDFETEMYIHTYMHVYIYIYIYIYIHTRI